MYDWKRGSRLVGVQRVRWRFYKDRAIFLTKLCKTIEMIKTCLLSGDFSNDFTVPLGPWRGGN